jgi:serine/threonine protein kinase
VAKLCDLGMAVDTRDQPGGSRLPGTSPYLAPELYGAAAAGQGEEHRAAADLWSLRS